MLAGSGRRVGVVEDLVETLTRGNVTDVKVLVASVVIALACYQLVLIEVGYRKVRPAFLESSVASKAHRAVGDAILVMVVVVAIMCLSYFELEDDTTLHAVAATALLAVLALKELRGRRRQGRPSQAPGLGAQPARPSDAEVQLGSARIEVRASEAQDEERARLWPRAVAYNPLWGRYQRRTRRRIPLIVLRPLAG
jgi:hypothetical protein